MPDSPPETAEAVAAAPVPTTQDAPPAASSTTGTQGAEPTILESVKAALAPKAEEAPPASQTQETKADPEAKAEGEPDPDEFSDEEFQELKEKTRRRFQHLVGQTKTLKAEIESLQPKAAEAEKLQGFMQRIGLSPDEFNNTLGIVAAVKSGDPHRALEALMPVVAQLQQAAGAVIPDDLQEQVRLGYITEPHAREIATLRSKSHFAGVREQQTQQRTEAEAQQRAQQSLVQNISDAASKWETAKRTSDPDWHLKADRVHELVELHVVRNGYPQTADDLAKMLNGVHDKVTKEIKRFQPTATAVKPVSGESSTRTVAEPTSVLDAIKQRLSA